MHEEGKKLKGSRVKERGDLKKFSNFTRCSRRVFLDV